MMTISIQSESQSLAGALQTFRQQRLKTFRERLVREVIDQTVQRVVSRHPVETGRSRAAWENARQQLTDQVSASADTDSSANFTNDLQHTTAEVTNKVDYIVLLEEGTRQMRPHQMVSRSLAEVRSLITQTAESLFGEEMLTR